MVNMDTILPLIFNAHSKMSKKQEKRSEVKIWLISKMLYILKIVIKTPLKTLE
jgi:hypothetical protein